MSSATASRKTATASGCCGQASIDFRKFVSASAQFFALDASVPRIAYASDRKNPLYAANLIRRISRRWNVRIDRHQRALGIFLRFCQTLILDPDPCRESAPPTPAPLPPAPPDRRDRYARTFCAMSIILSALFACW